MISLPFSMMLAKGVIKNIIQDKKTTQVELAEKIHVTK